jgi:hypothetical protein
MRFMQASLFSCPTAILILGSIIFHTGLDFFSNLKKYKYFVYILNYIPNHKMLWFFSCSG